MDAVHPSNRALLVLLENQVTRTQAVFEDLSDEAFDAAPGGDCHSIREIGQHLLQLRRFQLSLLESPLAGDVAEPADVSSADDLAAKLDDAARLFGQAVMDHDPDDWHAQPDAPRSGPWGDDPTIVRVSRPFNDFTTHLGAIRAIRRIMGNPADRTQ